MEKLYRVSTSYAVFGLIVLNGKVIEAAPIARWSTGKEIEFVLSYFRSKAAIVEEVM